MSRKFLLTVILAALVAFSLFSAPGDGMAGDPMQSDTARANSDTAVVAQEGYYSQPEEVAAYIHEFGRLPGNYLTKGEAMDLGWDSEEGNLWEVTDGMSIGGDRFGNYEGLLPEAPGRVWHECDVNYDGGYRGGERLVYSSDGLVYYTEDHYESFVKFY